MRYPDHGLLETATQQLIEAGVEEGHISKLRELHPDSVVAMASLRSCALAEAGGQLPQGQVGFPTTERGIKAAFQIVYVADALQQKELDGIYGIRESATVQLRSDWNDRTVETTVSEPSGFICQSGEAPEHRPVTATMAILTILSSDSRFANFVRSHLAVNSEVIKGGRVVDEVKQAAAIAISLSTPVAVGAA